MDAFVAAGLYRVFSMKRFDHLEFGDARQPAQDGTTPRIPDATIRNETYFYKAAVTYWLAGDFEVALRNYSRALEVNSAFFDGWLGQVQMLTELGEYPEALLWADKALKLFPENAELLSAKAVACAYDGKFEKAMAYSDQSISKENISSRVWLARARVLMSKKSQIAQTCISNAIGVAGELAPIIRLEAGRLLSKSENYYAAIEYLNSAVRLLPKSALAWYELGCCQAKLGRPEAAVTLKQALKLHSEWVPAKDALKSAETQGFFGRLFGRLFRK
jgi:tetratricopeptide (TPR) repeat protein